MYTSKHYKFCPLHTFSKNSESCWNHQFNFNWFDATEKHFNFKLAFHAQLGGLNAGVKVSAARSTILQLAINCTYTLPKEKLFNGNDKANKTILILGILIKSLERNTNYDATKRKYDFSPKLIGRWLLLSIEIFKINTQYL